MVLLSDCAFSASAQRLTYFFTCDIRRVKERSRLRELYVKLTAEKKHMNKQRWLTL